MSGSGGRTFRISGSGWKAIPDVQEGLGGPPECPGVVRRPSLMSESGWEAIPDVQKLSRGHPGSPVDPTGYHG